MKKIIYRFVIYVIVSILVVSNFACNKGKNNPTEEDGINNSNGIHEYSIKETKDFLVKDGKTEYKIVYGDNCGKLTEFAVKELRELFFESTGVVLTATTDRETQYSSESKFLSIGNNKYSASAGVTAYEKDTFKEGFIIKTVGKSIIISGAYDEGNLFGVYAFLEKEFNFDCFSNDCYYIDKVSEDVSFKKYDVRDIPDLAIRSCGNSFITNYEKTTYRMRYTYRNAPNLFAGISGVHTIFHYLPKEKYFNDYREWYSVDGTQCCYTAHGDDKKYTALLNEVFDKAKTEYIKNPQANIFIFSQEDKYTWCNCAKCEEIIGKYGSESATMILFINDLIDKINEWFSSSEGVQYKRDFRIMTLAYQKSITPPKSKDIKLKDEGMICFASDNMDYYHNINEENNVSYYTAFQGWKDFCNNISVYTYQTNFNHFLAPFDNFNTLQSFYKFCASMNCYWFYDLGQGRQSSGATGWMILKNYIASKLAWNTELNMGELINKFFKNYYGEASDEMYQYFLSFRANSKNNIEYGKIARLGSIFADLLVKEYWPKNILEEWMQSVDRSIEKIENIKYTDKQRYDLLYNHITMERVSLCYLMVGVYANEYSDKRVLELKKMHMEDCRRLGIEVKADGTSSTCMQLWQDWGIV